MSSIIEKLFFDGIIIPGISDEKLIISYCQNENTLINNKLEILRSICPRLFKVNHNIINDSKYLHLNLSQLENLQKEFPDVNFNTPENITIFANSTTFYPVKNSSNIPGYDILGNEYSHLSLSLVYIRIKPGILNLDSETFFQAYSAEELISTFMQYEEFVDPHSKTHERFSDLEIKRLNKLLSEIHQDNGQAACLIDVMETVKVGMFRRSKLIENIENYCKECPQSREFFMKLFHIGLKMRGWSGKGPYPLKSNDTTGIVPYDELQDEMFEFQKSFDNLANLPIFVYQNETFQMSTSTQNGYTIRERMDIVLMNNDTQACIRMSSNWFVATAWYYMNRYFNEILFPKEDLQWII